MSTAAAKTTAEAVHNKRYCGPRFSLEEAATLSARGANGTVVQFRLVATIGPSAFANDLIASLMERGSSPAVSTHDTLPVLAKNSVTSTLQRIRASDSE